LTISLRDQTRSYLIKSHVHLLGFTL